MTNEMRPAAMLGVDAGGTKVTAGPVDVSGRMLAEPITEPSQTRDTASFVDGLIGTLRRAIREFGVAEGGVGPGGLTLGGLGMACAGTVDPVDGMVVASPNLPLHRVPLRDMLEKALGMPVVLENDANAAVLAEATTGVAAGLRHVVMLALGTGIGGGIYLDGRLYRGVGGGAGELGHMIVLADGEPCRCGSRGCLEMYASGKALGRAGARRAASADLDPLGVLADLSARGELDGAHVGKLATEGYPGAVAAVDEVARWLGVALVNLTNTFNPEMIVVGGAVSALGEMLLRPAREVLRELAMLPNKDQVRVAIASLGNSAGLVGGGLVAWQTLRPAG